MVVRRIITAMLNLSPVAAPGMSGNLINWRSVDGSIQADGLTLNS